MYRWNHERGCIFRYGAIPEGEFNCSCPHKDDPKALAPPWPEDEEGTRRWLEEHRQLSDSDR